MLLGGTYPALMALGMLKPAPAHAFDLQSEPNGKRVLILGAGLCGMTAAYELTKLGYQDVQVQNFGSSRDIMIRLPLQRDQTGQVIPSAQQSTAVMQVLEANNSGAKLQRVEYVGPQVGKELAVDGVKALIFVVIGIKRCLALGEHHEL